MHQNFNYNSVPDKVIATTCKALKQWRQGIRIGEFKCEADIRGIFANVMLTYFRRRAAVDWTIQQLCRRGKVNAKLQDILSIGITQLLYMDGIQPAAITDTCVRFTKRNIGPRPAGFVNAVLRNLIRTGRDEWARTLESTAPEYVKLDLSQPLYQQWRRHLPQPSITQIAQLLRKPAPLVVRRRTTTSSTLTAPLPECLTPLAAPDWMAQAQLYICTDADALFQSDAFAGGEFYVQDPSTLLAPAFLAPEAGENVADLCAAPGGKTLLLSELTGSKACIVAADRSPARLLKISENLRGHKNITMIAGDSTMPFLRSESFDAVLLDVPCTNTGVIRRRPDVRWRFTQQHLKELVRLQHNILAETADLLRPGGRLVYSTCSIEPEENREQIESFRRAQPDFELVKDRQLMPSENHDGAYAALLSRKGKML